ncbi:hypothetical protein D9757_002139 [Collybiopsis confluens]|uniref:HAD-like protein n=1 Tax=Collybiopsis confluens TaxID=2823264 RepID=A0A8H5HZX2_9AGAR|nr:hypothetical protein D9757_002139 [Collybiopsis confluens]
MSTPPPTSIGITAQAVLFDMDGTLIDSTPGLYKAWELFSIDYNLGDPAAIVHATHGQRLFDSLRDLCGIDDDSKLLVCPLCTFLTNLLTAAATPQSEIERFEDQVIRGGPIPLPGAIDLLSKVPYRSSSLTTPIRSFHNPAQLAQSGLDHRYFGTATRLYATRALERCHIPLPLLNIVTSDDVSQGKPHPEPYSTGASYCRVHPKHCLVVEDAVSGLKSGRAAGATTLAVCTSNSRPVLESSDPPPDFIISDLTRVQVRKVEQGLEFTLNLLE